jgi:hypothetical protein
MWFPWVGLKTEDVGANVSKATTNHQYLDGLYHPFMVILGMVFAFTT